MNQHKFTGDLESFADYFMKDRRTSLQQCHQRFNLFLTCFDCLLVYSSPYFPHLLDAWTKRHHPNLLFVFYEDLKRVISCYHNVFSSFIMTTDCPIRRIWEVKSWKLDVSSGNTRTNISSIGWWNICASTNSLTTSLSILNTTGG